MNNWRVFRSTSSTPVTQLFCEEGSPVHKSIRPPGGISTCLQVLMFCIGIEKQPSEVMAEHL